MDHVTLSTQLPMTTCALYELPVEPYPIVPAQKLFGDPAGVFILEQISEYLIAKGFRLGRVKRALGIDAGVSLTLTRHAQLSICLGISRREGKGLACEILSHFSLPILDCVFGKRFEVNQDLLEKWRSFSVEISDWVADMQGPAVVWLTEVEAERRWELEEGNWLVSARTDYSF